LTNDDWGAAHSAAGGVSTNLVGIGSTSRTFAIDAAVGADDGGADVGQGGDRWIRASISYSITLTIDVDVPGQMWSVNLAPVRRRRRLLSRDDRVIDRSPVARRLHRIHLLQRLGRRGSGNALRLERRDRPGRRQLQQLDPHASVMLGLGLAALAIAGRRSA
jgi:hypothetical protein